MRREVSPQGAFVQKGTSESGNKRTCSTTFAEALQAVTTPDHEFVCKDFLAFAHSGTLKSSLWVAFEMDPSEQRNNLGGRKSFSMDPMVDNEKETSVDETCFGPLAEEDSIRVFGEAGIALDRGHLAPSYAFTHNADAFTEAYRMSNVAPQAAKFNRYSWRITEEHLTDWTVANNEGLWVVVGVAYDNIEDPYTIPEVDGSAIPEYFWMAICSKTQGKSTAIYGRNLDENTPPGMESFIPLSTLMAKPWMQAIFPTGSNVFGSTDVCGESSTDMLSLGDHKDMDRRSDGLRVAVPSGDGTPCVATGQKVVLWHYFEGSGYDKMIAVKSFDDETVNLGTFQIKLAMNGGDWMPSGSSRLALPSNAELAPGGVLSWANGRGKTVPQLADYESSSIKMTGNDAVGLFECDVLVDVIGTPNLGDAWKTDKASARWTVQGGDTKDHELNRRPTTDGVHVACTDWDTTCKDLWEATDLPQ